MPTVFDYFAAHGRMTHPRGHMDLLDRLPADIPALCRVVQGLMIHVF